MIDLQSFCATPDDESRAWQHKPFSHGEFTYATNGVYAVRVPRLSDIPDLGKPKVIQAMESFLKPLEGATFESVAHVVLPDTAEVLTETPCEPCEGRGYDHDCPSCLCTCSDCKGKGNVSVTVKISVAAFGDFYRLPFLRRILALPNVQIAALPRDPDRALPALFRFDGGVAVLWMLRKPYDIHVDINAKTQLLAESSR